MAKKHKVLCLNGFVFHSEWYQHPWLLPSGKLKAYPAASRAHLKWQAKEYGDWLNKAAARMAAKSAAQQFDMAA